MYYQTYRKTVPTLAFNAWYLDDGTIIGRRRDLAQLLNLLSGPDVKSRGFDINLFKCEIWWPSGDMNFLEILREAPRAQDGIDMLKIPVGSDAYIERRLRRRIEAMKSVTTRLNTLEDSHIEFTMLRACLGSAKLGYAMRGIQPSASVLSALKDADEIMRLALESIIGDSVPTTAWNQAGLRPSSSGLGLRHAEDAAMPAFIGSAAQTADLVLKRLDKDDVEVPGLPELAQTYLARVSGTDITIGIFPLVSALAQGPITKETARIVPNKCQALFTNAVRWKIF